MSFLDLFSGDSKLYATARPQYPDELFDFIASMAPGHQAAWDCATGSGQAAVGLSKHFAKVCASDASGEQVAHAHQSPRIEYSVQTAEETAFPDRSFDAVCVAQALHWFNREQFFREVRRVSKPGAVFAAWGYDTFSVSEEFDACFKACVLNVLTPYWAPQIKLLWHGYADVVVPFPRLQAPAFQIEAHWTFNQLLAYVHTWSGTRAGIAAMGAEFFESAERQLAPLWGDTTVRRTVTMPLHVLAASVR